MIQKKRRKDLHEVLLDCILCDDKFRMIERLHFSEEEKKDVDKLIEYVRFATQTERLAPEACRVELTSIQQGEYEEYHDFLERIRELAEEAYSETDPIVRQERMNYQMLNSLQDGLFDRGVAKTISKWRDENPRIDFESVAAAAHKKLVKNKIFLPERKNQKALNVYAIGAECSSAAIPSSTGAKDIPNCTFCGKRGHTVNECFRKQTCQLCNKEGHTGPRCREFTIQRRHQIPNGAGHNTRNRQQQNKKKDLTCWNCDEEGHVKRYCPKPISDQTPQMKQLNGQAVGAGRQAQFLGRK